MGISISSLLDTITCIHFYTTHLIACNIDHIINNKLPACLLIILTKLIAPAMNQLMHAYSTLL